MTTTELKRLLSKDEDLMMNCLRMTCLMMTTAETKRLWSKDLNKRDLSAAEGSLRLTRECVFIKEELA